MFIKKALFKRDEDKTELHNLLIKAFLRSLLNPATTGRSFSQEDYVH